MRLGRIAFPAAVLLGLAWFALRSPVPVADPRFIKEDFAGLGAPLSISVFLDTGAPRDQAHKALNDVAAQLRQAESADAAKQAAALDAAMQQLAAAGIRNAVVNFGGTLRARGKRGEAPWRIGLRTPHAKGPNDVLGYLLTSADEAVATRDDRTPGGSGGFSSVTVVGPDTAAVAGAADAIFSSDPEHWRALATRLKADQVLVVVPAGGMQVTANLNGRLKLLNEGTARVVP